MEPALFMIVSAFLLVPIVKFHRKVYFYIQNLKCLSCEKDI